MSTPDIRWNQVAAFLAVMREGSLSAAARRLGSAQPTIRRQIEDLEAELGFKLFSRAQNGLTPTPPATALLPQALAIESAIGSFTRVAHSSASDVRGTVRLTCSVVFGTEIIPPILAPMLRGNEGLEIELVPTDRVADLLRRDCDIAIRMTAPKQGALIARQVKPVEIGLHAHADYVTSRGMPADFNDLCTNHDVIGADTDRAFTDALIARGLPQPQKVPLRTDDPLALLSAIRAGIGIGPCQSQIASRIGLIRVLPEFSAALDCWVVMHEDLRDVHRVRLVFDHLAVALR